MKPCLDLGSILSDPVPVLTEAAKGEGKAAGGARVVGEYSGDDADALENI